MKDEVNMNTENKQRTNFDLFVMTVNSLASSQGSYARIARNLSEMDDDRLDVYRRYINSQPPFKDYLDVILFLEQ